MEEKKNNFVTRFIIDFLMIVSSLFKFIPNLIFILEFEATAAGKSLVSLLMLYLIAGTLLTSTWLCLLSICFIYFISLHLSWLLSLFIIVIINLLLLIITGLMILRAKNILSFPQTRHMLQKIKK
jgi:hypothetical protein